MFLMVANVSNMAPPVGDTLARKTHWPKTTLDQCVFQWFFFFKHLFFKLNSFLQFYQHTLQLIFILLTIRLKDSIILQHL